MPDAAPIRAFLALEIPAAARRAASAVQCALRDGCRSRSLRWVPMENLHVTLRFLGEVEGGALPRLAGRVAAELAGQAGFALRLGALEVFPSLQRPRVVALGLRPAEPLAELAARVERGTVAAGFPPEERPFRGHLTLGRVRGGRVRPPEPLPEPEAAPFRVAEVVLFQSQLSPSGSTYTALERLPLGGNGSP